MFTIVANCVQMAVEPNPHCPDKSPIFDLLEYTFQIIYTVECLLKIFAFGFVL